MTIAIAQNLLNIDSTEFRLRRSIYSNQGLLDVSWILVLFLIIELCTLAANALKKKRFPAYCCLLSEMKTWQCGFAFKNLRQWNFPSTVTCLLLSKCTGLQCFPVLHFVFKNPLWGGAPQLIKMPMSSDHTGRKPELNKSEESQTLCALANSNYRQYSWQGCVHTWNPFTWPFKDPPQCAEELWQWCWISTQGAARGCAGGWRDGNLHYGVPLPLVWLLHHKLFLPSGRGKVTTPGHHGHIY